MTDIVTATACSSQQDEKQKVGGRLSEDDEVDAVTDGEPDDLIALLFMICRGVRIRNIIVLNDKCAKDGWDRTKHVQHLVYLAPLVLKSYKSSNPPIQVIGCNDLTMVPSILFKLVSDRDSAGRAYHIISMGNVLSLLQLADLMTKQTSARSSSTVLERIPVWTYGSVNFRWAAKSLIAQGHIGDAYEWMATRLNNPNLPLQFHIFETFGAFGTANTMDRDTAPALYNWIATDQSELGVLVRRSILGWNKLMMSQILTQLEINEDKDALWLGAVEGENMDHIMNLLKHTVLERPESAINVKILTAILYHPCEIVFADIGLVIAAMNLSHCFLASEIGFSKKGRPYTTASVNSLTQSASTYFAGTHHENQPIWPLFTNALLDSLVQNVYSNVIVTDKH